MARFKAVGAKDVGAALLLDQFFARFARHRRQQQIGETTLRHPVHKEVAGRWPACRLLHGRGRYGMAAVDVGAERRSQPISEDGMLLGLLVSNESLCRRTREMTVAGRARLDQSH